MKRLFTLSLLFAVTLLASATDIPATILSLHKAGEKVECNFTETKTMPKTKKETKKAGLLTYVSPNDLRLDYTDPAGDYVNITATLFEASQGGKKQKFNIKDEKQRMAVLRSTLLLSLGGDVNGVAKLNEAEVTCKESSTEYTCTLNAKQPKHGIAQLTLVYNKKTGRLVKLVLTERNGNYTTYSVK